MERYDGALRVIAHAEDLEREMKMEEAAKEYLEAVDAMLRLLQSERREDIAVVIKKHCSRLMDKAQKLKELPNERALSMKKEAIRHENAAKEAEKNLRFSQAAKCYTDAAVAFRQLRLEVNGNLKEWAGEKAISMLEKAELYTRNAKTAMSNVPRLSSEDDCVLGLPHVPGKGEVPPEAPKQPNLYDNPAATAGVPESLTSSFVHGRSDKTKEEEVVIRQGSKVNGKIYEPMYVNDADYSNFSGDIFKDPAGLPPLSQKQKREGAVWARLSQIYSNPVVIKQFTYENITQTLVGDCSFVSSLAVCASWERRYGRTLISRNIYPQKNNVPVISPSGKYMIKMYLNGAVRKIIIDDYLPVVQSMPPRLLCSYSRIGEEVWLPLYEKAYMKLHGGYDFPGSTSSIDLHALCGWIPETFHLKEDSKSKSDPEEAWRRLEQGQKKGTALFTMGTKALSDVEEERSGSS
eukprot:759911-Hanusia_phi.AAC.9